MRNEGQKMVRDEWQRCQIVELYKAHYAKPRFEIDKEV